jgi:hypothetical protein
LSNSLYDRSRARRSLFDTVASLGLEQTLRRFQPEYLREGRRGAAAWLVKRVARTRLATNLLILAGLLFAWNTVAPHFGLACYRLEFETFGMLALRSTRPPASHGPID